MPYIEFMNSLLPFLIPALIILILVIGRAPKSSPTSTERPDFIKQATESIHVPEVVERLQSSDDNSDYNYEVVGESFQRDHLMALIRSHKAFSTGEILATAILEPEPTNPFDPTAVKVVIEGVQVGYIAKFDSAAVTKMIEKSGKSVYEVPAKIGFDAESPAPLIGVKIALTVE
jgi:imidazole glycerol phosphate synthase subunit HisF